jgi:hypothetical protein
MRAGGGDVVVDTGHIVGSRAELMGKRRLIVVRGTYLSLFLIVKTGSGPTTQFHIQSVRSRRKFLSSKSAAA